MKTIELNSELKTRWPDETIQASTKKRLASAIFNSRDGYRRAPEVSEVLCGIPADGYIYHMGYLRYLELCWKDHLPAVITPDIVWQMILCELALVIKKTPN